MADAQVGGPPRERDEQIEALEEAYAETLAKYRAGKIKPEAFKAAKSEFATARAAWKLKADKKRGVA